MPLGVIEERKLNLAEEKKKAFIDSLQWPKDEIIISRLSGRDFIQWIYSLAPRDAFIIMGSERYKQMAIKRGSVLRFWFNPIWRLINGIPL